MKTIDQLIPDINNLLSRGKGWTKESTELLKTEVGRIVEERFTGKTEGEVRNPLRLSAIGTPNKRQLWYDYKDESKKSEVLPANVVGTFFYGDLIESWVIALAVATGHRVECLQERVDVFGVPGHLDCIIDGVLVDVKSANMFSFNKFKTNSLRKKDDYGYLGQLSSYLYSKQKDPRLTLKHKAAFLAINKEKFELVLDIYDFTEELKNKEKEISETKVMLALDTPPERCVEDIEDGKSGNRILDKPCIWCRHKEKCWENLTKYQYTNEVKYFTKVVKEPKKEKV